MIEPDYNRLSFQELRQLCDERKIPNSPSAMADKLVRLLLEYDYEHNQFPHGVWAHDPF